MDKFGYTEKRFDYFVLVDQVWIKGWKVEDIKFTLYYVFTKGIQLFSETLMKESHVYALISGRVQSSNLKVISIQNQLPFFKVMYLPLVLKASLGK